MDISQVNNNGASTIADLNEPAFACIAIMVVITVMWVSLFIIAKLYQADNEVNLITYLVDNHGKTINRIILAIVIVLWALAAYFNHFT